MLTITSFADVVAVAKTFGTAALDYAVQNNTININAANLVAGCKRWATNKTIEVDNFNDGNTEYSIDAVFSTTKVAGEYMFNLEDITIVRTGFGAYSVPVVDAVQNNYISTDTLRYILSEIKARNDAAIALGL